MPLLSLGGGGRRFGPPLNTPLLMQHYLKKYNVWQISGPQQRRARVLCTPCTLYCYATEYKQNLTKE